MVKRFLVKAQSERQEKRGCVSRISVLPVSDYQLDRKLCSELIAEGAIGVDQ